MPRKIHGRVEAGAQLVEGSLNDFKEVILLEEVQHSAMLGRKFKREAYQCIKCLGFSFLNKVLVFTGELFSIGLDDSTFIRKLTVKRVARNLCLVTNLGN